jgi:hypothetical protein
MNIKEKTASARVGCERAFPYYYAKFRGSRHCDRDRGD